MNQRRNRTTPSAVRPAVTVIVDHRKVGADLAPLLERLRAACGPTDRIIVWSIEPYAARAATRNSKRIEVVDRPGNGWAAGLSALAATVATPICVVEDGAVPMGSRWLSELLQPIIAGEADVVVPSTNGAPFPSCPPDAPAAGAPMAELRDYVQRHRAAPQARNVDIVHGPIAVFAPGELSAPSDATRLSAMSADGLRVRELTHLYVHDRWNAPMVSACLIVKDEASELAECLASLQDVADEVIVYDTGSTDETVAIARAHGAVTIEGEWRNDFAWARNQALSHARGTWILSIDADERLEFEPDGLRAVRELLASDPPIDRFVLDLFDLQGSIHAPARSTSAVPMSRIFRRTHCHWVGALHEQPAPRPSKPPTRDGRLASLRFLHKGYLDELVKARNKWARNLEVATAALSELPSSSKECFDLGRSLRSVGDHQRSLVLFERAAEVGDNEVITRAALEFSILTLTETGQAHLSWPYLDRLRELPEGAGPARYLEGWVHIHAQEWDAAIGCFDGLSDYNDRFTGFRSESLHLGLAIALRGAGRRDEAAEAAVSALQLNPQAVEAWAVLLECADPGGTQDLAAATAVPDEHLVALFARFRGLPVPALDRIAEALWKTRPGNKVVLAAASQFASSLESERVLQWSLRLREHGLAALCPALAGSQDSTRVAEERAELLLRLIAVDDDPLLGERLEQLVDQLEDERLPGLLSVALAEAPDAAAAIIVGGATTPRRSLDLAQVLADEGFGTEAVAVLSHAVELDMAATRELLLDRPALASSFRQMASDTGRDDLVELLPRAA